MYKRQAPRPRPAQPTAATSASAASPVPTVPIPPDRGRAGLVGTSLLRLPPTPGGTAIAPTKLDAVDDATELQFADSVARYSRADWERKQQDELTCHAAMRNINIGRPSALSPDLSPDFLSCYPSYQHLPLSDIQELAGKGQIHTTDDDIVLLVRNSTPAPTPDA